MEVGHCRCRKDVVAAQRDIFSPENKRPSILPASEFVSNKRQPAQADKQKISWRALGFL